MRLRYSSNSHDLLKPYLHKPIQITSSMINYFFLSKPMFVGVHHRSMLSSLLFNLNINYLPLCIISARGHVCIDTSFHNVSNITKWLTITGKSWKHDVMLKTWVFTYERVSLLLEKDIRQVVPSKCLTFCKYKIITKVNQYKALSSYRSKLLLLS